MAAIAAGDRGLPLADAGGIDVDSHAVDRPMRGFVTPESYLPSLIADAGPVGAMALAASAFDPIGQR